MSKAIDVLRAIGVRNTHELLSRFGRDGQDFAICFTPHSRFTLSTFGTYLYSPRGRLKQHFSSSYAEGRDEAKAFAAEKFGITEWAPDPTDRAALIPKYVRDAAMQAVKDFRKGEE